MSKLPAVDTSRDVEDLEEALAELEGGDEVTGRTFGGPRSTRSQGSALTSDSMGSSGLIVPSAGASSASSVASASNKGTKLIHITGEEKNRCGGLISSGAKFCWNVDCNVNIHRTKRAALYKGALCIGVPGKGGKEGYLDHVMQAAKLDPSVLAVWTTSDKTVEAWKARFEDYPVTGEMKPFVSLLDRVDEEDDPETTKDVLSELLLLEGEFEKKGNSTLAEIRAIKAQGLNRMKVDQSVEFEDLFEDIKDVNTKNALLGHENRLDGLDTGLDDANRLLHANDIRLQEEQEIRANHGRLIEELQEDIGTKPRQYQGNTLWNTVVHIGTSVESFSVPGNQSNDALTREVAELKNMLGRCFKVISLTKQNCDARVAGLELKLQEMEYQSAWIPSPPTPAATAAAYDPRVDQVDDKLESLRSDFLSSGLADFPLLERRIEDLEKTNKDIQQKLTGENVFHFRGKQFASAADVKKHLGPGLAKSRVSWFMDIFTGVCICGLPLLTGREHSAAVSTAKKAGLTLGCSNVVTTFSYPLPPWLYETKAGSGVFMDKSEGFGHNFKTFNKFAGTDSESEKDTLEALFHARCRGVEGMLATAGSDEELMFVIELCNHLLEQAEIQLASQLTWITRWHNELVTQCKYTTEAAWKFIGSSLRAVYEDLAKPRSLVSRSEQWDTEEEKSQVIWAVLNVHSRMKGIMKVGYKAHPVVATAMSNFLMTNRVDPSQLTDMTKKVDAAAKLTARVQTLETDFKTLKHKPQGKTGANGGKRPKSDE